MEKKSKKSEIEIEMERLLKKGENIIDDKYLTTREAREVLDYCYKILSKCEELRKSRDNWRNKYEKLKNE